MAEVRINGRRMPVLQSVSVLRDLVVKLEQWGDKRSMVLTSLHLNGAAVDLEAPGFSALKLADSDLVEARVETPNQMAFESLQVAQEMAELLIFDLKVATIQMWEAHAAHQRSLETLIDDCYLFLTLAARPLELLGVPLEQLPYEAERCLRELDAVAQSVEDTTLLTVHGELKDACSVLVQRVLPSIERWMGLSGRFGEILNIDNIPARNNEFSGQLQDVSAPDKA
jgi:hypothetical protein